MLQSRIQHFSVAISTVAYSPICEVVSPRAESTNSKTVIILLVMTPRWSKDPRIMSLVGTKQISNHMALSKIHQVSDRLRSKTQLNLETTRTVIADELFDRRRGIPFLTAFCLLTTLRKYNGPVTGSRNSFDCCCDHLCCDISTTDMETTQKQRIITPILVWRRGLAPQDYGTPTAM